MDDNWTRSIEDTTIESSSTVETTLPQNIQSGLAGLDSIPVDDIGYPDDDDDEEMYEDDDDAAAELPVVVQADTPAVVKVKKPKYQPLGLTTHGFRVGSDSAIIVDILVAGGLDRQDINDRVAETINIQTRSGRQKNIPSLISGLLSRLEDRGYMIESNWRVVPPSRN